MGNKTAFTASIIVLLLSCGAVFADSGGYGVQIIVDERDSQESHRYFQNSFLESFENYDIPVWVSGNTPTNIKALPVTISVERAGEDYLIYVVGADSVGNRLFSFVEDFSVEYDQWTFLSITDSVYRGYLVEGYEL